MTERSGSPAAEEEPRPEVLPARRPGSPVPAAAGPRTCGGSIVALLAAVLGGLYILNPTAGLLELLPDNLPMVGNLDEAGAATLLVLGLQYLLRRRGGVERDPPDGRS